MPSSPSQRSNRPAAGTSRETSPAPNLRRGLLALGSLLVVAGFLKPVLFPVAAGWDTRQAKDYAALAAKTKELSLAPPSAESRAAFREVKEKYEASKAKLEAARSGYDPLASLARFLGIACCLAGLLWKPSSPAET